MPQRKPIEERFWSHVDRSGGKDACWEWTAYVFRDGYGSFALTRDKKITAHRFAYELTYGKPPADKPFVLHLCHNRLCVCPAHLHAGTQADNMREMSEAGRTRMGEKCSLAKLTTIQVREIRRKRARADVTVCQLAAEYNVSYRTIYDIVSHRTWAHIPDDETAKQS